MHPSLYLRPCLHVSLPLCLPRRVPLYPSKPYCGLLPCLFASRFYLLSVSVRLFVFASVYLTISVFLFLSVIRFFFLYVSVRLFVFASDYLTISVSLSLSLCLCLSASVSVYLTLCPSLSFFIYLSPS